MNNLEPEDMLKVLIEDGFIIINNGWWDELWPKDAITVAVNCNDVFLWGCADAENILYSDIEELYNMYIKEPTWGIAAWCIKKRKCKPQKLVEDMMIKLGYNIEELIK